MAKVVMGARKKELGAWRENGGENSVNAASMPWSLRGERWERAAAPSVAIKCVVILRDDHIFVFCVVRKRAHILELFQRNVYALPSFSHFSHFIAHVWPPVPKACVMPTNPHMLVQRSWRCAWGIHCEYIHLVYILYTCMCDKVVLIQWQKQTY